MTETAEAPEQTDAETQTHGAGTKSRKRRSLKGCVLSLFLLLVLLVVGVGLVYLLNKNGSDRKFNDYITQLTESGEALSVDEVVEKRFALTNGMLDTTREWKQTVETFNSEKYTSRSKGMSLVGDATNPRWPPTKWRDFNSAISLVEDFRKPMITAQLATAGYAFWSDDYLSNPLVAQETIDGLRRAFDFLELSCYVAAHQRKQNELVYRLIACLTFSNSLARHPGHLGDRLEMDRRALLLLMRALTEVQFSETELSRFRDLLTEKDDWQPINDYWDYQRALRLLMYNDLDRFRETALFQQLQDDPKYEEFLKYLDINIKYSPFSGDDAIQFLESMKNRRSFFAGNLIQQAEILEQMEDLSGRDPQGLDKYRHPTSRFMVPRVSHLMRQSGDVATHRNVTLGLLAADQYRVRKQQLPGSLSLLMDGFLDQEPIDLYTANPVSVVREGSTVQIMSYGPNKTDNSLGQDDIGFAIPLEKWDALSGPVAEVD